MPFPSEVQWWMKLEYLAVYGRASMAAFRRLSTHGQKFDTESLYSLCNLKLCIHIWSTNINFRPPLHWTFWSVLVWTFTLWVNCRWGGGGWLGWRNIFCHVRQKRNYLSRASLQQCARDATKRIKTSHILGWVLCFYFTILTPLAMW